jgi:hypothetical protein
MAIVSLTREVQGRQGAAVHIGLCLAFAALLGAGVIFNPTHIPMLSRTSGTAADAGGMRNGEPMGRHGGSSASHSSKLAGTLEMSLDKASRCLAVVDKEQLLVGPFKFQPGPQPSQLTALTRRPLC